MAFQGAKVVKKIFMAKCLPVIFSFVLLLWFVSLCWRRVKVFSSALYILRTVPIPLGVRPRGKGMMFIYSTQSLEVFVLWEKE